MNKYRIKTVEEFKKDNYWNYEKNLPFGWNSEHLMDYLYGQELPGNYTEDCNRKQTISIPNLQGRRSPKEWSINFMSYTQVYELVDTTTPQDGVQFDLTRVAKDIDNLFKENVDKAIVAHNSIITESKKIVEAAKKVVDSSEKLSKELMEKHLKGIKDTYKDIKSDLISEISRGRSTIIINTTQSIDIKHMDHPKMEDVISTLYLNHKVMLVGPAGTGKTYMVAEIADRMKLPFYKYSCSRDSSVHDLLGYKQPRSETYLETTFLNAYENGGIFLVDEYDAMSGDMSLFFNGIADNSKFISIPHRDVKPVAKKHKDFYLVMCGNTWGKGSIEFSGRDFQDQALMDRFRLCRHHIGYHEQLEKEWMGSDYNFATIFRKALEERGNYLSTRNIEDISLLLKSGKKKTHIVDMLLQDVDSESKKAIRTTLTSSNQL